MNRKLPCEIIQDLLPSYLDEITSEVTTKEVANHLATCKSCEKIYIDMKNPSMEQEEEKEEFTIDYLKKVRISTKKRITIGILGTILVIALGIFLKLYVIGFETTSYTVNAEVAGDTLKITGQFYDSASVYARSKIKTTDQGKEIVVYACLPSFWNEEGSFTLEYPKDVVSTTAVVGNYKIGSDGTKISPLTIELFGAKNRYIGNMSKNWNLTRILQISNQLGAFKNSLQTTKEPYGWTLEFETPVSKNEEQFFNEQMTRYSYVLLALVDNLGEVSWTYQMTSTPMTKTITSSDATTQLNCDIKSYAQSEEQLEMLISKLKLN